MLHQQILALCAAIFLLFVGADRSAAQTNVTTGSGNAGYIPYFLSATDIESSIMWQTPPSGNVWDSGNIAVGGYLYVFNDIEEFNTIYATGGFSTIIDGDDMVNGAPWYGFGQTNLNLGYTAAATQFAGYYGLNFQTANGDMVMRADSGYVGVNTQNPTAQLEVKGNVKLTAGTGASMTYADGTVQSTAWNGTLQGGDYAESIDVGGQRSAYTPGDLIAIDPSAPGKFIKASSPYSKLVAGVYSTKPGLLGRRTTADRPDKDAEIPMAMMGIVPTKVTAENGPIEPGDMLVASSRAGYAMKGTNRNRMVGATVGKALAPLASGQGTIEVLVSLQ